MVCVPLFTRICITSVSSSTSASRRHPFQTLVLSHLDHWQSLQIFSVLTALTASFTHPVTRVTFQKQKFLILSSCLNIFYSIVNAWSGCSQNVVLDQLVPVSLEIPFLGPRPRLTLDLCTGTQQSVFQQFLQIILMHTGTEAKIFP